MKYCNSCNTNKELTAFGKDKSNKDGLTHRCKECRNPQSKAWRKKNPEIVKATNKKHKELRKEYYNDPVRKLKYKDNHLQYNYGITLEIYEKMHYEQNGKCKICKNPETTKNNQKSLSCLAVDHCHKTGKVRGLLCAKCNKALGAFKDNIETLTNAINYLRSNI